MSIVFDFVSIAARMNHKPEPVKIVIDHGAAHTHTLTIAQLAPHSHTITDPGHAHTCVGIDRSSNPFWENHG
jgi:hypothetical protein